MKAHIITDLSFGDAGKGTTVDYLARQAPTLVVRHNGGPQAAHNVVTPQGQHHTFAQFGSGSFAHRSATFLSRFMLINPLNMFPEAEHLISLGVDDIWNQTYVDKRASVITPWHQAANRLREKARGNNRHGSCAQGIGETMACNIARPDLAIRVGDINASLVTKLQRIRRYFLEQLASCDEDEDMALLRDDTLADDIAQAYLTWKDKVSVVSSWQFAEIAMHYDQIVFEGAQGVLLDEWYGFHPYTTWSTTTSQNALQLLRESGLDVEMTRFGILRAYTTRHGPGPFVTEDATLTQTLPDHHNGTGQWQGAFRVGHLDLVAHRYAIEATRGVDQLVVTGLDRQNEWVYCDEYQFPDYSDVGDYFEVNSGEGASRIRLGTQGDLDYQARLGELLEQCHPTFSPDVVDEHRLIRVIEASLGAPVTLVSYGPSAADKHAFVTC